tara:strand:+ start:905 stop:1945 length:1041 start_codon:yes stop_codon:yes gene_type:complete
MDKKILITGGAGFIGSALIRYIINNTSHSVINVDKLTYAGNLESLFPIEKSQRYSFEKIDICDASGIDNVLQKYRPDILMHLAAESHVDRSIEGPSEFINTNITGTYTLLEAAKKYWLELPHKTKNQFIFHHISTDEVFGDLGETNAFFTEKSSYMPSSPYSASKASSDHLVRSWHRTYNLPIIITNCSNNYGPYQFPEKLIPLVILNAINGKKIPIYGDGKQVRDWLYVEDHAEALLKTALEGTIGESYNIGGRNELKNIDVVKMICNVLNEIIPPDNLEINDYQELITHVNDRAGHDVRYAIDCSKIVNDLGWEPNEIFETGIRKTIEWYLKNIEWCNNISRRD